MKSNQSEPSPRSILSGTVIHGRGIGKLVGMPTANLQIERQGDIPSMGVYITKVYLGEAAYCSITHIGLRPTIDSDDEVSVETHILNFNREIYGHPIKILLYEKIRDPQKFANLSLLLEQIRFDCLASQAFWGIEQCASRLGMDLIKRRTHIDNREIQLSVKEFDVLYLLFSNPDVAFTKEQIYESIWHEPSNGCCHAVENTVFQIRKKTKADEKGLDFIKTVTGYGYRLNATGK